MQRVALGGPHRSNNRRRRTPLAPQRLRYGDKIRWVWYSGEGGEVKEGIEEMHALNIGVICRFQITEVRCFSDRRFLNFRSILASYFYFPPVESCSGLEGLQKRLV